MKLSLFQVIAICCILVSLLLFTGCGETDSGVDPPSVIAESIYEEMDVVQLREDLKTGKIKIPLDWYKTKNPEVYAEYLYAHLIEQLGDTPRVRIFADAQRKMRLKIPLTLDEMIQSLEVQYSLFPDERTLKTLEKHRKMKADGIPFVMIYREPGETQEQTIQRLLQTRKKVENDEDDVDE